MDDNINLATHFRGVPGNHKCPECDQDHGSLAEYKEHLWTHREENAGGPITPEDRRRKCPHPRCIVKAKSFTKINEHLLTHTGQKSFACPHLSVWTTGHRELCGYAATTKSLLRHHRSHTHGLTAERPYSAADPWVDNEDITLSEAVLNFGDQQAGDRDEVKEEVKEEEVNAQLNDAPPPQPPAPVPGNVQVPGNGTNIQAQVPIPVNIQHAPANMHQPIGPHGPWIPHTLYIPHHFPHHVPQVPHHRLPNGHVVGMQLHAPPPNRVVVIPQEGEQIVDIVDTVRCWKKVPSRFHRYDPIHHVRVDIPEYELGEMRVIRGWRRVRTQPVHPPNDA